MAKANDRHDEIQGQILHVYDGIEEADNRLPLWWLITFYGAIAFGAVYWFYYHEYDIGQSQRDQYAAAQLAQAQSAGEVTNDGLSVLGSDPQMVEAGRTTFAAQCVACHDEKGQGKEALGPNLTDNTWINGGSALDIYNTITDGVPAKGMVAWGPVLGAESVKQLTAYLLSIRNTNVPGKAPEGEVWPPQ